MKHFMVGVVFSEEDYESIKEDYEKENMSCPIYDYFAYGDYVDFVLFDITDEKNPKTLITGDNTHEPIEAIIDSFLEGCRYAGMEFTISKENLFIVDKYYGNNIKYKDCKKVN